MGEWARMGVREIPREDEGDLLFTGFREGQESSCKGAQESRKAVVEFQASRRQREDDHRWQGVDVSLYFFFFFFLDIRRLIFMKRLGEKVKRYDLSPANN